MEQIQKHLLSFHLKKRIILIGGTEYAGEMKKSIFSIMNYLLPEQDILIDALLCKCW